MARLAHTFVGRQRAFKYHTGLVDAHGGRTPTLLYINGKHMTTSAGARSKKIIDHIVPSISRLIMKHSL